MSFDTRLWVVTSLKMRSEDNMPGRRGQEPEEQAAHRVARGAELRLVKRDNDCAGALLLRTRLTPQLLSTDND